MANRQPTDGTAEGGGANGSVHFQSLHGLFRINTDISAGNESLSAIADKAAKKGLDFIVVSDQFLVQAEYGPPPFRNVLKVRKNRRSVTTLGVDKYLAEIAAVDKTHPKLVVIPGADVAPHYFWTGNPVSGLATHQFSRQLTVFGTKKIDFYKNLPVIHNEQNGLFFPHTPLALLPLLIAAAGAAALFRKKVIYKDLQGNTYRNKKRWPAKIAAALAIIVGILWTIDNKPFTGSGFAQYADNGRDACQTLLAYVRKNDAPNARIGVFWSAPEARSTQKMAGVTLVTEGYVDDILGTSGSDGFAGIYADTSTERYPGSFWDELLGEHIAGKRPKPLFIVGERDYHGQSRAPLDYIKTVVLLRRSEKRLARMEDIVSAITAGNSYAVCKSNGREIELDDIALSAESSDGASPSAIPGETLEAPKHAKLLLRVAGHLESSAPPKMAPGFVVVVLDGKKIAKKQLDIKRFAIETAVSAGNAGKHYVRFYIESKNCGRIVCNPIFFRVTAD